MQRGQTLLSLTETKRLTALKCRTSISLLKRASSYHHLAISLDDFQSNSNNLCTFYKSSVKIAWALFRIVTRLHSIVSPSRNKAVKSRAKQWFLCSINSRSCTACQSGRSTLHQKSRVLLAVVGRLLHTYINIIHLSKATLQNTSNIGLLTFATNNSFGRIILSNYFYNKMMANLTDKDLTDDHKMLSSNSTFVTCFLKKL